MNCKAEDVRPMNKMFVPDISKTYRNILILESRDWWENCKGEFDPAKDLVLTYDLALQREITGMGGQVYYVDHLVDNEVLQENNFLTYRFFKDWHLDVSGEDIFVHRGIPFGFAFRIEIWNDLLSYVRASVNLERLREMRFEKILVGTALGLVESILKEMGLEFAGVVRQQEKMRIAYYFPIHRWMDERVRLGKFKHKIMRWFIAVQGVLASWVDRIFELRRSRPRIYLQVYHPTRKILQKLREDSGIKIILGHFSHSANKFKSMSKYLTERPIPIWGDVEKYAGDAERLLNTFRDRRSAKLILTDKTDLTTAVYSVIEERIASRITLYLRDLDCIIDYIDRNPIQMEVMIANIGRIDTLVDCVCKKQGIPGYLIINGILGPEYCDEAKYATVINAYSISIKENYFRGMSNIVCLGDPRMDDYVLSEKLRVVNRNSPTVTIGASGFNIMDLNGYVAIEFEFMWDVLEALQTIKNQGVDVYIVIKVRSNGYREQYESFAKEYFPGLVDEIQDIIPMRDVLEKTDLYISINSQTLFEASCLGIPCIYYKNDTEFMCPPFDNKSELVTVNNVPDLVHAITDFRSGHVRFDEFLQRPVMEKYIGPLDGKNLQRNLDFINSLLQQQKTGAAE